MTRAAKKVKRKPPARARRGAPQTGARTASGWTLLDLVLVSLSGAAMWASFPALGWWFLMVPSLALLIAITDRVGPLRAAGYSALWAMVFFMPHISWMQIATDGTWPAWVALAGAQAFFIALWGASFSALGTWRWARSIPGEAIGAAVLWVAFEELRSRIPYGGFAWGKLAYPQVDSPMMAYAPLGGEVLVAFLLVAIAVLLRRALAIAGAATPGPWARLAALGVGALLFFAPALVRLPNSQQAGSVRVGLVQGNVEIPMAETFSIPRKVTGNHVTETFRMVEELESRPGEQWPEVVFWGENATDLDPRTDPETAALVQQASDAVGVPMAIGLMEYEGDVRYNWIGVWYPQTGLDQQLYGKQHPVPWGEYIPLRALTLRLAPVATQISVDMVAVDNPGFMQIRLNDERELPIAVGICFEVAYQPLIAEGVRMGGQMIYIPTNNAHFQESAESLQQLQMAQFRAAQFSRSALQVSTNGVSAIVRPDGSVQAATPMQVADNLVGTIPLRTVITPSARLDGLLAWLAMLGGGSLAAFSIGAHIYGRSLRRSAGRKG